MHPVYMNAKLQNAQDLEAEMPDRASNLSQIMEEDGLVEISNDYDAII